MGHLSNSRRNKLLTWCCVHAENYADKLDTKITPIIIKGAYNNKLLNERNLTTKTKPQKRQLHKTNFNIQWVRLMYLPRFPLSSSLYTSPIHMTRYFKLKYDLIIPCAPPRLLSP